ncbi:geranylgeranyl transferase type-1 subunit beta [Mycoemilia scoparia]|uniref:Geranylgeranyl transferase type-1 subunit beta n=1 Tax=Mycoemilia scoparia TaxID=417184 RepID=A0A9W8A6I8_9FUNG|nr:geranylgeranyl transferase type-1 subunit beta [Mycoemilia scoparia]
MSLEQETKDISIPELNVDKHVRYFKRCADLLPHHFLEMEASRMTLLQFCIGGLDILSQLETALSKDERNEIIEWIYEQQVVPGNIDNTNNQESNKGYCGFRGGPLISTITPLLKHADADQAKCGLNTTANTANCANLAATYSALATLAMLGDDFSRVNRKGIVETLRTLQKPNGSFIPHPGAVECDMRFLYSACIVSYFLNDWSGVDIDKATDYIKQCTRYDGGVTQEPYQESHGGSYFCAIASLKLMGKLDSLANKRQVLEWGLRRQIGGFQGRVNKPEDILGGHEYIHHGKAAKFVLDCQHPTGGIGKMVSNHPDPLHSYLGLVGLSYSLKHPQLRQVIPHLNLTSQTSERIHSTSVFLKP